VSAEAAASIESVAKNPLEPTGSWGLVVGRAQYTARVGVNRPRARAHCEGGTSAANTNGPGGEEFATPTNGTDAPEVPLTPALDRRAQSAYGGGRRIADTDPSPEKT